MFLITDVLADGRFVQPYCADVMANTPEMPIAELVLQIRIPIENHQGTLTFRYPINDDTAYLGGIITNMWT